MLTKSSYLLVLFGFLSLLPFTAHATQKPVFHYSNKDWYIAFQRPAGETAITEIIPVGETINTWSEMLTQETLPPLGISPSQYVKLFISNIENKTNQPVKYHVFNTTSHSVSFEWWIPAPSAYALHEWYKLISYPNQTLVLRYTTKQISTNKLCESRKNWQEHIINWNVNLNQLH